MCVYSTLNPYRRNGLKDFLTLNPWTIGLTSESRVQFYLRIPLLIYTRRIWYSSFPLYSESM